MEKDKNILIISMNPLDNNLNNGKTLVSFFKKYRKKNLAQLYFSEMLPNSNVCDNYFKISDKDMLWYRFNRAPICGSRVMDNNDYIKEKVKQSEVANIKKTDLIRLFREFVWDDSWKSQRLFEWLDDFNPQIIFFVAGDVVYSHKICLYIRRKYNTKLAVFVTDDYILPRNTISLFWWVRRNYVLKYMRRTVKIADLFITISEDMRQTYYNLFQKDSFVAANLSESMKIDGNITPKRNYIEIVYTGGLHLGRDKSLKRLAIALQNINSKYNITTKLKIYSAQKLSEKQKKYLTIDNVSSFEGLVEGDALKKVLNNADFLVHVESFKKKYRDSTRLSLSTKIPEYLSVGKPIIAIGPQEIASMRYLRDVAIYINTPKELEIILSPILLGKEDSLNKYGKLAEQKYNKNHFEQSKVSELMRLLKML